MFTGITRGIFDVTHTERRADLLRYVVDLGDYGRGLEPGASVSIDGCCQTVVTRKDAGDRCLVTFDAIVETLEKTTLGALAPGSRVSVERSARVGDEIGGHDVSGHIVGTGQIVVARTSGHDVSLELEVPRPWMKYLSHKGYVALDGSSLTVGDVDREAGRFDVHLIPETLRLTNFGAKADRVHAGEKPLVNVELDPKTVAIVDTVERLLPAMLAARDASRG
ncbi:MAG: riboflavin synthase subunit alpha [Myxococcota bacterium]